MKHYLTKKKFLHLLMEWYHANKRELPWRGEKDPYKIWISEIILQQTRVEQGIPYYLNFLKKFPDISSLANSDIDNVLKVWEGLGYYRRALYAREAAKQMMEWHSGKVPAKFVELLELKGIGEYTAAAVASIAFHEPVAVVDGNVLRFFSRLLGIKDDISLPATINKIRKYTNYFLDQHSPGEYNQAIMEMGATCCTPKNPNCNLCPFQKYCYAFNHQKTSILPQKTKKINVNKRYFIYYIIEKNNTYYFQRREKEDIWKGMYEPLLKEFKTLKDAKRELTRFENHVGPLRHVLSHQHIYAFAVNCNIDKKLNQKNFYSRKQLKKLPMPVLVKKLLNLHNDKKSN
ncbi:MAG: A/G-specific adenine glycosylase [Bacteroidia bacterium]|nr:A/G-specific adenine glycosylase [Bacteroidia bacterium]